MNSKRATESILAKLQLPMISTLASAAATAMFLRSLAANFLPAELNRYLQSRIRRLLAALFNETTLLIYKYKGLSANKLFSSAEVYVGAIAAASPPSSAMTLDAFLRPRGKKVDVSYNLKNDEIFDVFDGIRVRWQLMIPKEVPKQGSYYSSSEVKKYFRLSFDKGGKEKVVEEYLPYVVERAEALKREQKTLKLFTLTSDVRWQWVDLNHPSTFETLALDEGTKKTIVEDLQRFIERKDLYKRVGKAWKRGYLLYGPPGTGKSSLIAAMANYLKFDVYDLELTSVTSDSQLRQLLLTTSNRSILVVEDIDASLDLTLSKRKKSVKDDDDHDDDQDTNTNTNNNTNAKTKPPKRASKVTLSGVLNFIDGLWSSIGDERIIIFTTNHKKKLDPALLRPGRMDMHVHMSYCSPCGFRLLAKNYLGSTEHPLVSKAEQLIGSSEVSPAEVGEQLLKSDDPGVALEQLIKFLEAKIRSESERRLKRSSSSSSKAKAGGDEDDDDDEVAKVMSMAKALPLKTMRKILGTSEAAEALKVLTRLLEQEVARFKPKN